VIDSKNVPRSAQLSFSVKKASSQEVTSFSIDTLVLPDRSPKELQTALICSSQDQNIAHQQLHNISNCITATIA